MKKQQDPLDAEIHEMLDFYWKAAQRADEAYQPTRPAPAPKPLRRKVAVSKKLSALRATRHAIRDNARAGGRSNRRVD